MALLRPNSYIITPARDVQGRYLLSEARSRLRYEPAPQRKNDPDLTTQYDRESRIKEKLAKLRIMSRMG